MKAILFSLFTLLMFSVTAQTNPQIKINKNSILKDNISKISASLNKNDVNSISSFFEPSALANFKSSFTTKQERQGAAHMLKGQIIDQTENEKMISGYGYQIHFLFKKDKWVIKHWDIFSAD